MGLSTTRTLPVIPPPLHVLTHFCPTQCVEEKRRQLTLAADPNRPSTPPSSQPSPNQPPQFLSRPSNISDDEEEYGGGPTAEEDSAPVPPKGGYDGRVQQILYENPDLEIVITDAGKSSDGGYIVYKIRTGVGRPLMPHVPFLLFANSSRRTLKLPVVTQSSALYVLLWSISILLWSSRQFPRSTRWPITLPNLRGPRKMQAS